MSKYHKALKKVSEGDADKFKHLSKEQIDEGIAAISEELKGPMSNTERLMLVGDRADLRAALTTK
jgi:hypothetical protein